MKVLVDTSVWIDHLHRANERLQNQLGTGEICTHPVVIGELACGSLKDRDRILAQLLRLPLLRDEPMLGTLRVIEENKLWGRGLGWSDMQILASCKAGKAQLWTGDISLRKAAADLEISQPDG